MCTSPLKAYVLNKQKMFEQIRKYYIDTEEGLKEAKKTTQLEYEEQGQIEKHKIPRISWKPPKNIYANCYDMIELPCNKCTECLLQRSKEWALRCMLEAKDHKKNCFLTLTYNEKNLPADRRPKLQDFQNFIKRLRKYLSARQEEKIKYLACGEIGPKTLRGHFHACLFGYEPDDLKFYKKNEHEQKLFYSKTLNKIWGKGYVIIGALTYESASYVSRYCTKKLKNGNKNEYIVMSRKPGIAANYLTKYKKQIWNDNGIYIKTANGVKLQKIPKYAMKKYKEYFNTQDIETNEYYTRLKYNETEQNENKENILNNTSLNWEQILEQRKNKMEDNLKLLPRTSC